MAGTRSILCTRCGAPLALHLPRAKTVVCAHCRAQLDLTKSPYEFLGVVASHRLQHPLRLGLQANLDGAVYTIVGQVRYAERSWWWDEYLAIADDGRALWIQYDEGEFQLFSPFVPSEPEELPPDAKVVGVDGEQWPVKEQGRARVAFLDGEFTFRVKRGDVVQYLDAPPIAVELTEREVEYFRVRPISRANLAEAVGLTEDELAAGCYTHDDDEEESFRSKLDDVDHGEYWQRNRQNVPLPAPVLLSVFLIVFFLGGCLVTLEVLTGGDDDDGAGGTVWAGGGSGRSSGRGSFGGGFSGGK